MAGSSNPSSNRASIIGCSAGEESSGQVSISKSRYIKNLLKEKNPSAISRRSTAQPLKPTTASETVLKYSSIFWTSVSGSSGNSMSKSRRSFSRRDTFVFGSSPVCFSRNVPLGVLLSNVTGSSTNGARRVSAVAPFSTHFNMPKARKSVLTPCSKMKECARR